MTMTHFRNIVSSQEKLAEELPLVHTSRCENFPGLIAANEITTSYCTTFKESLIYLFYGRPAYRSKKGKSPGESVLLCPVCFVFRPQTVSKKIRRVYPCDSGALSDNLFKPDLTKEDLQNLELDPRIESARRLVPLLFGNNTNYFYGTCRTLISGVSLPGPGQRFHQLLLKKGPVAYDDRKSAIEVQVKESIFLRDQLLCVILPRDFLRRKNIRKAILQDWGCDAISYPTFKGGAPSQYYPVIQTLLAKRFEDATRI
jgi:hypothetical protein